MLDFCSEKNSQPAACIERIVKLFTFDSFELLDCVLTDDEGDPHYSPNMTIQRFNDIIEFHNLYSDRPYASVEDYLLAHNYSRDDLARLKKKHTEEREADRG